MNSALILTRFRSEHLPAIIALHRSAMEGFITGIDQTGGRGRLAARLNDFISTRRAISLWDSLDGQVVAMGGFKRHPKTTAEMKRMRVDKLHQGRGYGTELLIELSNEGNRVWHPHFALETASSRDLAIEVLPKARYNTVCREGTIWRRGNNPIHKVDCRQLHDFG